MSSTSPQKKYQIIFLFIQVLNDPVSELLPTFPLMSACFPLFDRECRIQQQYTLVSPFLQTPLSWQSNTQIIVEFFKNIS